MSFYDRFKDVPIEEEESSASISTEPVAPAASEPDNRITFDRGPDTPAGNDNIPPRKKSRLRGCLIWLFVAVVVTLAILFYLRYLNPYVTDARDRVYIERVEKRGIFFKTYEVQAVRPDALDNSKVYSPAESFSVANDSLALRLQDMQNTGHTVTITYERFYGILPWRGASHNVITAIDE